VSERVLVTGAAGFIGSHVVDALLAAGHTVTGVDNFDPFYARAVKERNLAGARGHAAFRFIEADLARDAVPVDGADVVAHLAAKAGVRPSLEDPAAYVTANVLATARVLEACRRAGVRRVIYASSSSVYGVTTPAPFAEAAPATEPISPYAATKRAGELVAHTHAHLYGLRVACLRFFTVYGPRQRPDLAIHRMVGLMRRGEPVRMFGDGSATRDYTYISDAVDGVLGALRWTAAPGGTPGARAFNVGGGAQVRLDRLIAVIASALGRTPRIERHPDQPGDVPLTSADLRRSERELGYRPTVGIEDGIRAFVRWYEEIHGPES
jgi:UDP-glucuronate 4-epimerase